jgi:hypothetical protein
MTKTTNPVKLTLAEVAKAAGFTRKGGSWYRRNDDLVEVLNLQKSNYSNKYYLNYAIWVSGVSVVAFPPAHQCHIQTRADEVIGSEVDHLLDLEAEVPGPERVLALGTLLRERLVPFMEECRTLDGLRKKLSSGHALHGVAIDAKRILFP